MFRIIKSSSQSSAYRAYATYENVNFVIQKIRMQYYEDYLDLLGNVDAILHHFLRFTRESRHTVHIRSYRNISIDLLESRSRCTRIRSLQRIGSQREEFSSTKRNRVRPSTERGGRGGGECREWIGRRATTSTAETKRCRLGLERRGAG